GSTHSTSHLYLTPSQFFFSSRRRHTRWPRDWSSDVCSSDLELNTVRTRIHRALQDLRKAFHQLARGTMLKKAEAAAAENIPPRRSEERRVGKECRSRWSAGYYTNSERASS